MDRIWQWAWDRYQTRYSWAVYAVTFPVVLPFYLLLSFVVVAFEGSGRYVEAAAVTVAAALVLTYMDILPGVGSARLFERWAAGHDIDRARALDATYTWARGAATRVVAGNAAGGALLAVAVGAMAGATGSRLAQYGIL